MCGIAGYIGPLAANAVLLVALERLKYRGYDSAGIVLQDDGDLSVRKAAGRLRALESTLQDHPVTGGCGIAHTRWATHGQPTTENAHPHCSNDRRIAVVHNGIIENHEQLRHHLEGTGTIFDSQTDSEVIPHLLAEHYSGDPIAAVRATTAQLEGSYAFAAIFADHPDRIIAVRRGSPLLIGRGKGQMLIASDVPALLPHAHESCQMEDGWTADLTTTKLTIYDADGRTVEPDMQTIEVSVDQVTKGDFDSFMAKEIAEQPSVLRDLLASRIHQGRLVDPDLGIDLHGINRIVFLACGTSWHAAMQGKLFLEHFARVHVEVDISSEYRYRNPIASGGTLVIAISQSGETADTLAGLRLAKSKFIPVISLVNVMESTMARESDGILPLMAGPEIGVASTKAYTAQVLALYLFALQMARARGRLNDADLKEPLAAAAAIPGQVEDTLIACEAPILEAVDLFAAAPATVFLGRGGEYPTALEGALKLKEISYIYAAGYAAGEFKHGAIALVTDALPVICLCPPDQMRSKMLANIEEVRARQGRILAVGAEDDHELAELADHVFPVVKASNELLQPLLSILPLQRYAYHVARRKGCDVDQPRNLAKSVTVE